jgi:glycosyltransferase involved in cell wall biosynthesis
MKQRKQTPVSIGLPVFNGERFLEQALDSVIEQTFEDFELVISDNASTDHTQEICLDYCARDKRLFYHRSEINTGAAPNFNRVFHLSSGKYFKWAAYDDKLAPKFLEKCVDVLDHVPEVVLCHTWVSIIDENGALKEKYIPKPETAGINAHERFRNLILHPLFATQVFGLTRSEAIRKTSLIGSYPSSDEVLLAELALLGEFYEIPEYLFMCRFHPDQSTRGNFQTQRARTVWFDTSLRGKIVLPKWIYFFACLRVIRQSNLSFSRRVYCYTQMARWVLVPAHFRAMGKDGLIAANQLLHSLITKGTK